MKQKTGIKIALMLLFGVFFSCATSNNVASERSIQKRKYNKGFFIDFNKKLGGQSNEVVMREEVEEESNVEIQETALPGAELQKEVLLSHDNAVEIVEPIQEKKVEKESHTLATTISDKGSSTNRLERLTHERTDKSGFKIIRSMRKFKHKNFSVYEKKAVMSNSSDGTLVLYIILAILIPFLAVLLVTDFDIGKTLLCLLLTLLGYIPGLIYALVVVANNA